MKWKYTDAAPQDSPVLHTIIIIGEDNMDTI
jgi:hypothetical protein